MSSRSSACLLQIETYYDAVPRSAARVELIGTFTLFINAGAGWPYYARPTLGATSFHADDVRRVRARQRELGAPETFEWVAETTPTLAAAAQAAGLAVTRHPLMLFDVNGAAPPSAPIGVEVRLATVDDDLGLLDAIAGLSFSTPGTAVGAAGLDDARKMVKRDPALLAFRQERLRAGRTVTALALVGGQPVGVASHQPVGSVSEVVGMAVLPAFRRRGIAAALTTCLVNDALARGVHTIFLSAGDETIGRIYERVGFRQIGTACIAEPTA